MKKLSPKGKTSSVRSLTRDFTELASDKQAGLPLTWYLSNYPLGTNIIMAVTENPYDSDRPLEILTVSFAEKMSKISDDLVPIIKDNPDKKFVELTDITWWQPNFIDKKILDAAYDQINDLGITMLISDRSQIIRPREVNNEFLDELESVTDSLRSNANDQSSDNEKQQSVDHDSESDIFRIKKLAGLDREDK